MVLTVTVCHDMSYLPLEEAVCLNEIDDFVSIQSVYGRRAYKVKHVSPSSLAFLIYYNTIRADGRGWVVIREATTTIKRIKFHQRFDQQ